MIIGISGRSGSGKDTVGKIINLLKGNYPNIEIIELIKNDFTLQHPYYKIKKFADSLKDIVCLLIGCTREQLEYEEFKNTELSEEWWFWEVLTSQGHLYKSNLTDEESYKIANALALKRKVIKPTPRFLLQHIGTDLFRNQLHPNIWVNSLMNGYKDTGWDPKDNPNWLITDTRFPNEVSAIKERDGILIRVNRGDGNTGNHPSENSLDNYENWDYIIDNNGTIEELIEKVKIILIKEKLI